MRDKVSFSLLLILCSSSVIKKSLYEKLSVGGRVTARSFSGALYSLNMCHICKVATEL